MVGLLRILLCSISSVYRLLGGRSILHRLSILPALIAQASPLSVCSFALALGGMMSGHHFPAESLLHPERALTNVPQPLILRPSSLTTWSKMVIVPSFRHGEHALSTLQQ